MNIICNTCVAGGCAGVSSDLWSGCIYKKEGDKMYDKNGVELKCGDVVRISGAYFKNDNGLYFVDRVPGVPNWTGKQASLKKICKNGRISTAKYNLCFWPISVFVSDPWKRAAAYDHNKEYATIEVVRDVPRGDVAAHFQEEADELFEAVKHYKWQGFAEDVIKPQEDAAMFYQRVANIVRGVA